MTDVANAESTDSGKKLHLGWALVLISVAQLMAETIARIASGESVMSLFADQDNLF